MWARTIRTLMLFALAAWLCGCAMQPNFFSDPRLFGEAGGRPAKPGAEPRAVPTDAAELDEAIQLIEKSAYKEAASKLLGLIPRLAAGGDEPAIAEATFWLGYCREKQQRSPEAVEYYTKVVDQYGDTPAAPLAAERLKNLPQ